MKQYDTAKVSLPQAGVHPSSGAPFQPVGFEPMKILSSSYKLFVRLPGTNKFLRATGRWTRKVEHAFNFPNPLNAIHTCLLHGFSEVEFVFRRGRDEQSFPVRCV